MTGFSVIGIYVHDMDKAKEFYCENLGFKIRNEYDDGCIVQLEHDGPTVILEKVDKKNESRYPGQSQIVLCIESKDIERRANELKSRGVEFIFDEPRPFVAGKFMVMRDPSGNVLQLLQFKE